MKNQKGSAAIWIIVILVIIVIACAAYWYWSQNSNQPTSVTSATLPTEQTTQVPTQTVSQNQQTQSTSNASTASQNTSVQVNSSPSATINQSSLTTSSDQPTLSGTATGVSTVKVEIWKPDSAASGGFTWWTGMIVHIVNGDWSASVAQGSDATTLPAGTYKVDLLDWDNSGSTPTQLTQGTLTVSQSAHPVTVQNQNGQMTATPTTSNTWQITFSGPFAEQQQSYVLDYGDGTPQVSVQCETMATNGQPVCNQLAPLTHKYAAAGTYQVKLLETFVGAGPGNEQTTTLLTLQVSN